MKQQHQDVLCGTGIEFMLMEIRSQLLIRGEKSFTTLIRQFQSTDVYDTKLIGKEEFKDAICYFKSFHLSDIQINKLFNHYMQKDKNALPYMNFVKAIAGPPNTKRVK